MPKYRVTYLDDEGVDRDTEVVAADKDAAADKVLLDTDADSIEEVEEV